MGSDKKILMVVANQDFRDEEYLTPRQEFEEAGIAVATVAGQQGECVGVGGTVINSDFNFDEVEVGEYDAVVFVGGIGCEQYFADEAALKLARDFATVGKFVCAICWAPVILAHAGLLEGKKVTVSEVGQAEIKAAGAIYTGEMVTVDGKIITAIGPETSSDFGSKVASFVLSA